MNITIDPSVNAFLYGPHGLLADGKSGPVRSGADMSLYDPATGAELACVACAGAGDVDRTVAAARRALEGNWVNQHPADHEYLLLQLAEQIEAHGEQLTQLEILDNDKSINLSRVLEVGASVEFIRYTAGWATRIEGRSLDLSVAAIPDTRYRTYMVLELVGVVEAIVPWNFPLLMAIWKIVPTLVCGYTVVLKPADETPLTALYLGQLCLEVGTPSRMVNIVAGMGAEADAALAAHPGIDKLAFTGSAPVSKLIGRAAVEDMTRFSLELGGKSPVVTLDDTNLDMAATGSAGIIFFNQGRVRTAGSRLYVQRKHFDQVLECLTAIAGDLSIGPGLDPATQINPLVSARQQERVLGIIESGVAEGTNMARDGARQGETGFYAQPTILADVTPGIQVVHEEIFGPVLVATSFDDLDETTRPANDSIYRLGANIWSGDLHQIMDLMPRIEAGTVWMNARNLLDPSMPFDGFKQSGIGRKMGHTAIEAYTENKSVCIAC